MSRERTVPGTQAESSPGGEVTDRSGSLNHSPGTLRRGPPTVHACVTLTVPTCTRTLTHMLTHSPHVRIPWSRGAVLDPLEQALPLAGLGTEPGREGQRGRWSRAQCQGRWLARWPHLS